MGTLNVILLLLMGAIATSNAALVTTMMVNDKLACGTELTINATQEIKLDGMGKVPATKDCTLTFKADDVEMCQGICYQINPYAFFNTSLVTVSVSIQGKNNMVYTSGVKVSSVPQCSDGKMLTFTITWSDGYMFDPKKPAFDFVLEVYNKCGDRGMSKSVKFEEVVKYVEGFHTNQEFEDNVRSNYTAGILLGFGLASIFLVVLLIAWCYTRNSPNRGPNRSVGMPKVGGFKKKMKVQKETKPDVEMGVRYQHKPEDSKDQEGKPLLTGKADDPEKPPVDISDHEDDEKNPCESGAANDKGACESSGGGGGGNDHSAGGGGGSSGGYTGGGGGDSSGGGGGGDSGGGGGDSGGGGGDSGGFD